MNELDLEKRVKTLEEMVLNQALINEKLTDAIVAVHNSTLALGEAFKHGGEVDESILKIIDKLIAATD